MKKNLLLLFILVGFVSNAQNVFWQERSTGFLTTSTNETVISYADANTVWIYATAGDGSGDYYQQWGRSLDGGDTWTNGPIDLGNVDLVIGDICAVSATTAYIVTWANASGLTGGVYVTNDAGVTWQKQASASYNTGTDSFPDVIYFWDANKGVTVGDPASGYFEIYTTTNAGANWVRVPEANIPASLPGEYGYTGNREVRDNIIWFTTNKGRIYKSTDYGLNWTVSQSPISDFGSAAVNGSIAYKDENNGLLITNTLQFFRTTDGATWNEEFPVGYYRDFEIAYVPGTANTYVCTGTDPDGIGRGSSYSTDGGANWVDINGFDVTPNDGANSLSFYDPTHGLSGGFTTDAVTAGIWKWVNDASTLAATSFSNDKAFTAFINISTGMLEVNGKNITNVTVFDVLGKQVSNNNFTSVDNASINASNFNNGIYLVKVTNNAGAASTIKVVKN